MSNSKKERMFARGRSVDPLDLNAMILEAAEGESRQPSHPVEWVQVDWIIEDETIQVRVGGLHQPTVKTYTEVLRADGELPPIDLFRDHDSKLFLGDGFHRLAAHRAVGHTEIEAYIWPGGYEAAYRHAEESNLKHGRPLSDQDKYNLFTRRVLRGHSWIDGDSNRAIAKTMGVSHQTIGRWWNQVVREFPDNPHMQNNSKVVGADGRTYQTRSIRKANTRQTLAPEVKMQRRVIHNLRNAVNGLRKLGLDDDAVELEGFVEDLAATFEM